MEQDELIIRVCLWVCEQMETLKTSWFGSWARRDGFDPALSDDASCIELCFFKLLTAC